MIIVCDSSPVIALAILNQLDLLERLFEEVIVPKRVFDELTMHCKSATTKIAVWANNKVAETTNKRLMQTFNLILDAGESEAMSLYWEKEADFLLIDEKKGRKIALYNGIKIVGTLGILLLSKQKGFITSIKPMLDILQQSNIRISNELYMKSLALAQE